MVKTEKTSFDNDCNKNKNEDFKAIFMLFLLISHAKDFGKSPTRNVKNDQCVNLFDKVLHLKKKS